MYKTKYTILSNKKKKIIKRLQVTIYTIQIFMLRFLLNEINNYILKKKNVLIIKKHILLIYIMSNLNNKK